MSKAKTNKVQEGSKIIKELCLHRAEETLSSSPIQDNLNQSSFQWKKAELAWMTLHLLLCPQRLSTW